MKSQKYNKARADFCFSPLTSQRVVVVLKHQLVMFSDPCERSVNSVMMSVMNLKF